MPHPNLIDYDTALLSFRCVRCGRMEHVLYHRASTGEWERLYGDLPLCTNRCEIPFEVRDAIANWLDQRAADGCGEHRERQFGD